MNSALIIGFGQIGAEIAAQLSAAGVDTTVATRSGPERTPSASTAATVPASGADSATAASARGTGNTETRHIRTDASDPEQLLKAAAGADVIFACAHAAYDSRVWARVLPQLDSAVMDVAKELGIPVIFPESVYAFAGVRGPTTESSPFAPVEDKGRIRQSLIEARQAHPSTSASIIAGDLLGTTAQQWSSVVRMCITDPIAKGRRAFVPARTDVAHAITVIADLAAAMIRAAHTLDDVPAGTHRLYIAPSSNPTLGEVVEFTHQHLGSKPKRPLALPRWSTRAAGLVERSMFELNQLAPIWYSPCIVESGELAADLGTTDWREGVKQML